jgi:hypothetical protein
MALLSYLIFSKRLLILLIANYMYKQYKLSMQESVLSPNSIEMTTTLRIECTITVCFVVLEAS